MNHSIASFLTHKLRATLKKANQLSERLSIAMNPDTADSLRLIVDHDDMFIAMVGDEITTKYGENVKVIRFEGNNFFYMEGGTEKKNSIDRISRVICRENE